MNLERFTFPVLLWLATRFLDTACFGSVKTVVVNGEVAKLGEVPYQVSFKAMKGKQYISFCGGSIIGPAKVLSAAHCFVKRGPGKQKFKLTLLQDIGKLFVVAGSLLNRDSQPHRDTLEYGQWRRVNSLKYPKHFDFPKHDLAIVFIKHTWNFNEYVKAIGHAKNYYVNPERTCQISGFGRTGRSLEKGTPSEILLKARVHVKTPEQCERIHRQDMDRFICIDGSIADVRQGDSGGPLVCDHTGDPEEIEGMGVQVGIVSGARGDNTFFLRISTYYNWIKSNGTRSHCCAVQPSKVTYSFVMTLFLFVFKREINYSLA